jgi:hypothetical protein
MRLLLRAVALLFAIVIILPASVSTPAEAFGDTCYRDVRATGNVQSSMKGARASAIAAWESAVSRRYGSKFANWYYSADRTFDCSWNDPSRIRCVATAGPCGRKR